MFFVVCSGFGQQVTLSGKIMNLTDKSGIHVLNRTTNFNTITNQHGEFTITANLQDTLLLSSIRYSLKEVIITPEIYNSTKIEVLLEDRVNQLDEVLIGNQLSGNLLQDLKGIEVKEQFNFDDVGIPGFIGKPEEKIAPIVPGLGTLTSVDLESLYKHLSGYYKKLKLRREWEAQNNAAVQMITYYSPDFFSEAYGVPENRLYDYMLFCIETTTVQWDFKANNFAAVLGHFKETAPIYVARLENSED